MLKTINDLQYHYQIQGDGEPLLLLHGFTGSTENWRPLVPHLAKRFKVITVDLPGHGKTGSPKDIAQYEMSFVAADLLELITFWGHESTHLLGYSMGGRLALYFACHHPDKINKLILESASPGLATLEEQASRRIFDNNLADQIERDGIEKFVNFWESISLWESQSQLTKPQKATLRQIRLVNAPSGLANSLRGMGTGRQPSLWPHLQHIKMPTLLITGSLDHKFCTIANNMLPEFSNGRLHTISGAGHTTHLEQPIEWACAIHSFLS